MYRSSYQYYLDPKNKPDCLSCEETLSRFSNRLRRKQYQLFVNEGIDKEIDSFYEKIQRVPILGSEAFTKTITEKYLSDKIVDREIHEHKHSLKKKLPSVETVFQTVAKFYDVSMDELKVRLHKQKNIPRSTAVFLAIHMGQISLCDVAEFLGDVSYPAVAKVFARFRENIGVDRELAREVDSLAELLG